MKKLLAIFIIVLGSITIEQAQAGLLDSMIRGTARWMARHPKTVATVGTTVGGLALEFVMSSAANAAVNNAIEEGVNEMPMLKCSNNTIYPISNGCPAGTSENQHFILSIKKE